MRTESNDLNPKTGTKNEMRSLEIRSSEISSQDRNYLELLQTAETVAKSKAAILIQGERGSGKKTLARFIHSKSQRMHRALINLDCSSVNEMALFQAIEAAHSGTLLLVDVEKLAPQLQMKLFHVLQEGRFTKNNQITPVDLRIISTTQVSLSQWVKSGEFREDLFYRLNIVSLKNPALRDRIVDVSTLVQQIAEKRALSMGFSTVTIDQDVVPMLNTYRWPGNLSELRDVIEAALVKSGGASIQSKDVDIHFVPETAHAPTPIVGWKPGRTLDEIERNVILEALKYHSGNRTHTARSLGISIRTLRNKLAEYRVLGIKV